ncbi:MAG: histidinol-phosphate aminotransferase family protein [Candidatus Aenigmarchaeota archaeon]|nr:histidinol-phosphate aminotransferase family protein [Candidatus Aenigmarchaeota archaeon]
MMNEKAKWIEGIPHTSYMEVPENFIRLDLAVNKHEPSPKVTASIRNNLGKISSYPDTNWSVLVKKIAEYAGVKEREVLITNGLEEAIDIITRAFADKDDRVLMLTPTYSQFHIAAMRQKAKPISIGLIEERGFEIPIENVREIVKKENVKLLWLCNPNNPTGTVFDKNILASLVEGLGCIIVMDECFYEFCGETFVNQLGKFNNVIILRSFSKSFGLAGIRLGYIISNEGIIDGLIRLRQPSSVNILVQFAALAALEDLGYYKGVWKKIVEERENLGSELKALGFTVFGSGTNFLYVKTDDAKQVFEKLWDNNIFVFPSWDPEFVGGGDKCLRILAGLPEESKKLMEALKVMREAVS